MLRVILPCEVSAVSSMLHLLVGDCFPGVYSTSGCWAWWWFISGFINIILYIHIPFICMSSNLMSICLVVIAESNWSVASLALLGLSILSIRFCYSVLSGSDLRLRQVSVWQVFLSQHTGLPISCLSAICVAVFVLCHRLQPAGIWSVNRSELSV